MRHKSIVYSFAYFLTFAKIRSFHTVTSSDSHSRVFINFVGDKKNFILSSSKQKRILD